MLLKGGSASPISISIDDSVGIKITSPKKLTLSADSEIIMKTPKNVNINGVSQISALKSNTQSGFSLETDLHFLSDNIIKNGSSSESYPYFEDEPQAGQMPEPEPPKEEKKGFNWGKLIKYGLGAVVVAASVLTFGLGATIAIIAVSAVAVAAGAGASKAGQSNINSQLEKNGGDQSKIDYGEVLKAEFKGALTGAKDMIFTEGCVAGDVAMQTSTFVVDVLSFGTFHDRAEKASQWWHGFFKEKAPYKDSYEYLEYLTNIALMVDGAKSFDKMIKGIEKTGGGFSFSIANGGDLAVAGSTYSISVSAGEIGSMAVGGGAFYNVVTNKGGTDKSDADGGNNVDDVFKRVGPEILSKAKRQASEAKQLAIKYGYDKSKTVASSENIKTLSGWSDRGVDTKIFNRSATPEDVIKKSKEIGHGLTNGGANDHGVLGKSYASHAEKQLSLLTNEPIGVSRKMCSDCKNYFAKLAEHSKRDIVVADPEVTRIFTKDGNVVEKLN